MIFPNHFNKTRNKGHVHIRKAIVFLAQMRVELQKAL